MNEAQPNSDTALQEAMATFLDIKKINVPLRSLIFTCVIFMLVIFICIFYDLMVSYFTMFLPFVVVITHPIIFYFLRQKYTEKGIQIGPGVYPRLIPWSHLRRVRYSKVPYELVLDFHPKELLVVPDSTKGMIKRFRLWMKSLDGRTSPQIRTSSEDFTNMLSSIRVIAANHAPDAVFELEQEETNTSDVNPRWGKFSFLNEYKRNFLLNLFLFVFIGAFFAKDAYLINMERTIEQRKAEILQMGYPVDNNSMETIFPNGASRADAKSEDNAAPLYIGMSSALVGTDTPEYKSILEIDKQHRHELTESQLGMLQNLFENNQMIFPILDEARRRPESYYQEVFTQSLELVLLQPVKFRKLAQFLHLYEIAGSNSSGDGIKYLFDMSYSLRNERGLILFLTRRVIVNYGLHALSFNIKATIPTVVTLDKFTELLDRELANLTLSRAIAGEHLFYLNKITEIMYSFVSSDQPDDARREMTGAERWIVNSMTLEVLDKYKYYMSIISKDTHGSYPRVAIDKYDSLRKANPRMWLIFDNDTDTRVFKLYYQVIAKLRAAKAAIAVERFKLQMGRLPSDIPELEKSLQYTFPDDPFGESKLIYSKRETGYIIYSVGKNGIDENGQNNHDGKVDDQAFEVLQIK